MTADPTTITELASATDAQLRAVVDPDGASHADFSEAEAAGLVRQKWVGAAGEYDFLRTAKGERWLAELRRMAGELTDAQVGMVRAFRCIVGLNPVGECVLSLRLREQEGER